MVLIHGKNMHTLIAEKSGSALEETLIIFDRSHPAQSPGCLSARKRCHPQNFPAAPGRFFREMRTSTGLPERLNPKDKAIVEEPDFACTH